MIVLHFVFPSFFKPPRDYIYRLQSRCVALLISRILIFLLFWCTKLTNVLETSGRLSFYFSAFLFCCSDSTAFCFTIRLFVRTVRSNGHSYNFLFQFFSNPSGSLILIITKSTLCNKCSTTSAELTVTVVTYQ